MKKVKKLEEVLPLYKIENDCILSKRGDVTLAYHLTLPEIFTLSNTDYEALHQAWVKAIRLLPISTILHKQDWYTQTSYKAQFQEDDQSFLSRSSERHFHERPYLDHDCYIFLTKKSPTGKPATALSSSLLNSIVPQQVLDAREVNTFIDKAGQFFKILEDSGFFTVKRLTADQLVGKENRPGLLERYLFLITKEEQPMIRDIQLRNELKIGSYHTQIFTLANVEDLPARCAPATKYERYSTDKTKFPIGFAAPLGQLLSCNHIYNQFILIEDAQITLKKLENKRLRLQSLSTYSRENTLSRDATDKFLDEAISQQRQPIKAHFNICAWTENINEIKEIRNNISAALAQIDALAKQETVIAPHLFIAAMPGTEGEFPVHDMFDTFAEQAACFFNQETNYRTSLSPVGIRLGDRTNGMPVHVDISDEPRIRGIISNRNKFILGPSGSGKSFFTNHLLRSYYEQGTHIVVIDVGHSYRGLCDLVNGYYFTYTAEKPISFNPFYFPKGQVLDTERKESIKTLLLALWKSEGEDFSRSEYVTVSNAIQSYYQKLDENPEIFPCFNSFYEFIETDFSEILRKDNVRTSEFDLYNFLYVLRPFYKSGEFQSFLNAHEYLDVLNQPFIVFELDEIKDHPLFGAVTIVLMDVFMSKMRKLKGVRKLLLLEEVWKALMKKGMENAILYWVKTIRKFFGELVLVTQDVEDIIGSKIVKNAIINNSDCKILLDQSKYQNRFEHTQELLGLTEKEKTLILSMNKANDTSKKYKEVFISLGGVISKVYRTEVSLEEYLAYTTEEKEKIKVQEYAKKYGSMKKGIMVLANEIRQLQAA